MKSWPGFQGLLRGDKLSAPMLRMSRPDVETEDRPVRQPLQAVSGGRPSRVHAATVMCRKRARECLGAQTHLDGEALAASSETALDLVGGAQGHALGRHT